MLKTDIFVKLCSIMYALVSGKRIANESVLARARQGALMAAG